MSIEISKILAQMKERYLSDIGGKIDEIEELVIRLEKEQKSKESFDEIYRRVHSLKGSSGSYGLHDLSNAFHHLEDHLSLFEEKSFQKTSDYINILFKYLDLIRNYNETNTGIRDFKNKLSQILSITEKANKKVLIIENSRLTINLIRESLSNLALTFSTVTSGIEAITRLHLEHYDIIISAFEMPLVNGAGILAAAKQSSILNQNSFYILITSKDNLELGKKSKPNVMLKKDNLLIENIKKTCEKFLSDLPEKYS